MARRPKCQICDEEVIKEEQEWYKNSTGYFHVKCRHARGLPCGEKEAIAFKSLAPQSVKEEFINRTEEGKTIKCYFCGLPTDKATARRENGKAFHQECYPEYLDRKELFRYCCTLWGLKAPGPLISRQAKEFRQKGYTYRGMMFSLKYFYEVKHNDKNKFKGSETIGIIPFIYEDAKQYYSVILQKKQELAAAAKQVEAQEKQVVKYKPQKKMPELYNFD